MDNWEIPFEKIEKDLKKFFQFKWNIEYHIFIRGYLQAFAVDACIIDFFKVKHTNKYGAKMGIHYDYKSTRGEKAMRKEAKKKARLEQKRARKGSKPRTEETEKMHDIHKTITLEDLTDPNKN